MTLSLYYKIKNDLTRVSYNKLLKKYKIYIKE